MADEEEKPEQVQKVYDCEVEVADQQQEEDDAKVDHHHRRNINGAHFPDEKVLEVEAKGVRGVQEDPANDDDDRRKGRKEENSSSTSITKEEIKGDSWKSSNIHDPFSDLRENEKKALEEFRSRVEEAIVTNKLFKKQQQQQQQEPDENENAEAEEEDEEERQSEENSIIKGKAKEISDDDHGGGEALCLWGTPLMPSSSSSSSRGRGGDKGRDVVLLKFLRARDFKVNDALEMLSNTLRWRKENNIDSILEEDLGSDDYESMASVNGVDRRGHPACYNVYGVFANENVYNNTFGTQESRDKFLRWRLQLMERQIQMLDFTRSSSLLQINDLKDTPGPSRKDLRVATRQAVALLQDNYPEFVARNIFINVPFWYYAFNALLSPFLTQRTKSKFVFARANRVTETLLKYIAGEQIPVKYGGLKRENDSDFSTEDGVSEITVKAGSTEVAEIPAPEAGSTVVWDLTVIGWEVNYKEEFVPSADSSYTIIVEKERRIGWQEGSIRNSFRNTEPGKIVLTIENGQFKRKRVLYRFKTKDV